MKKFLAVLSVLLITGCGAAQAPMVNDTNVEEDDSNKTIGQQLDEAREELKDCEANCEEATTAELKQQCLAACQMAREYTEQVSELTKDYQDKTPEEFAKEMEKMYGITE